MLCRIVVADEHPLMLVGLEECLRRYDIVGSTTDGRELVEMCSRLEPDLVILDVSPVKWDALAVAQSIKTNLPAVHVVFLSMHEGSTMLRRAFQGGADGYVLKRDAPEEIVNAIEAVLRGEKYISAVFGDRGHRSIQSGSRSQSNAPDELTNRQREIVDLLADGKQNREIAQLLRISQKTVEFHRRRIMEKFGVHTIAQLVRMAIEKGYITRSTKRTAAPR